MEKTPDGFSCLCISSQNICYGHRHASYVRLNTWGSDNVYQGRYTSDPSLPASAVGRTSRVAAAIEG